MPSKLASTWVVLIEAPVLTLRFTSATAGPALPLYCNGSMHWIFAKTKPVTVAKG
jgi:hypothetical protein